MRRRWVAVLASRREIVSAYRWIELRAYCVPEGSGFIGKAVKDVLPGERLLIERMRRDGQIIEADGASGPPHWGVDANVPLDILKGARRNTSPAF